MSGKSELELLEALEAGPLHIVGEGPGECTSYHNLHVRGLVLGGYNPHLDRFDVALTAEGRARLEELRVASATAQAPTGNTHMVLNRLGYSYPGQILKTVHHELCRAHHEHPHFADNAHHAVNLLGEEFGEVCKALNDGDLAGAVAELGQTITVSLRTMELLLGELGGES